LASSIVNEYYKILRSRARWALTGFTKRGEEKKTTCKLGFLDLSLIFLGATNLMNFQIPLAA
jgi:hypothetical protein